MIFQLKITFFNKPPIQKIMLVVIYGLKKALFTCVFRLAAPVSLRGKTEIELNQQAKQNKTNEPTRDTSGSPMLWKNDDQDYMSE